MGNINIKGTNASSFLFLKNITLRFSVLLTLTNDFAAFPFYNKHHFVIPFATSKRGVVGCSKGI